MPRSKKKKPGNGRSKQYDNLFCISMIVIFIIIWMLQNYLQATIYDLLLVYFMATIAVIIALRALDRRAASRAMDILGQP